MAVDKIKNIRISGIACCVPENIVEIDRFKDELGEDGLAKFKKTTGILRKHCSTVEHGITAGDLCYAAAEKLIDELKVDKNTIDGIFFVTQSGDYICPATACILQSRLGLSRECLAYDINLGCSGWPYGIHNAASYMQSGYLKKILLLTGESASHDRYDSTILFGEAGTATLLEYDEMQPEITFVLRTIGEGYKYLVSPYGSNRHNIDTYVDAVLSGNRPMKTIMDGAEIFNFSIREVPDLVKAYFDEFDYDAEMFDVFSFHQANLIILKQIFKRLKLPKEKCPVSLDIYGNTSSASVPLAICDYFNRIHPEEKNDELKRILACGYGIGLSLGITSFTIPGNKCFPVITTNEAFEDGIL